ncbi:MAG: hypothetical protein AAFX87_27510 [Bacteroidota bacterium]
MEKEKCQKSTELNFHSPQKSRCHQENSGWKKHVFIHGTALVDAWRKVDDIGAEDALRKDLKFLKNVGDWDA